MACARDLEFLDQPWDLELRLWRSLHAFFRARYGRTPRRFEYLSWPRARHKPRPRRKAYWEGYWKDWETWLANGRESPEESKGPPHPWPPPGVVEDPEAPHP